MSDDHNNINLKEIQGIIASVLNDTSNEEISTTVFTEPSVNTQQPAASNQGNQKRSVEFKPLTFSRTNRKNEDDSLSEQEHAMNERDFMKSENNETYGK